MHDMDPMYSDGTSTAAWFPSSAGYYGAAMLGHPTTVEGLQVLLEPGFGLKQRRQFPLICCVIVMVQIKKQKQLKKIGMYLITSPK